VVPNVVGKRVKMSIAVFWFVTSPSLVAGYESFETLLHTTALKMFVFAEAYYDVILWYGHDLSCIKLVTRQNVQHSRCFHVYIYR
jgi:hypothetical protein